MKKIFVLLLLISFVSNAQEDSAIANKKNEFRVDILSIITSAKASLSYERFFNGDFSTGINVNYSNSDSLNEDFDTGNRNNVPKFEFNPFVRYALSKSKSRYYFAEVFGSYNGGDFREIVRLEDQYTAQKSTYTDFGLGGSLGYKMYFKESIALEFIVGFGSNLTNRDKSPDVISRVGINLGYRF